jgi:hypothetical protein
MTTSPTRPRPDARPRRRSARTVRIAVGSLIWVALLATGQALVRDGESHRGTRAVAHVSSWLFDQRLPVVIELDRPMKVAVGDPVFYGATESDLTLIGEVTELLDGDRSLPRSSDVVRRLRCEISAPGHEGLNAASTVTMITVPQTTGWVFRTLLPEEKIIWIARQWNHTLLDHRNELFEAIGPVVEALVRDFQGILTEDLPTALAARGARFAELGDRYEEVIIERELKPVIESDLWPMLIARAQPTLDAVGKEIIKRLPVWSLTWRFVYDALPLTENVHVRGEWNEFVETEIVPILQNHLDDFLGAFGDVIAAASKNERVGRAFRRSFDVLVEDPDFQRELRLVFQEIVLDNPRFHKAMIARWKSPEMNEAIDKLAIFMSPLLSRIGDAILGTRGGGITPEFARVLRTQILEKDRRWLFMQPGPAGSKVLTPHHVLQARVIRDD